MPHSHENPHDHVHGYVRALDRLVVTRAVIIVLSIAAAAVAAFTQQLSLVSVTMGVIAWLIVMIIGLATLSLHRTPTAKAILRSAIASAVTTPLAAFAIAIIRPWSQGDPAWATALFAGIGWLAITLATDLQRCRNLKQLLTADSRAGEVAREGLATLPGTPAAEFIWSIITPVLFGGYIWLMIHLPVALAVLVPLHVVIALASRRSSLTRGRS